MQLPSARRVRILGPAVVVLVAAFVLAACTAAPGSPSARSTGAPTPTPTSTSPAGTTTSPGDDGVTSAAIITENARPGTKAWHIAGHSHGTIAGFADHNYAADGDRVGLYVSTTTPTFTATAYRMGWYGGDGARQIWTSGTISGRAQPACPVNHATNMVSCANWSRSVTMPVGAAFVPGDYLIKLTSSTNAQSYVMLTVWQPDSHATYLLLNRSMVEQGWNTFGGYSFYSGVGGCILDHSGYPPCNRARVVSFDRPYTGDGSSDFLTDEFPMVELMEKEGLDVTYCTDICLSDHPAFFLQHRALIDTDHDETWTNSERMGVLAAAHHGVNLAFFGAATLVRHARLQPSSLGPDREEVDYRNPSEDPMLHRPGHGQYDVTGNTWSQAPANWSAAGFLGQLYSGYLEPGAASAALSVFDAHSWFFQGTGLSNGDRIPGVINSDIEHLDPAGPFPHNLQVLAHSPISLAHAFTDEGEWGGVTYSDATYYTNESGAGVLDSGDNSWVTALIPCAGSRPHCTAVTMAEITNNVLRLFGSGPAALREPSVPNWRSVSPVGS